MSALETFSIQCTHLVALADQLRRDARYLTVDLAFTHVAAHLEGIHTLAGHVSEATKGRVEERVALEKRALLTAAERKQAHEVNGRA